MWRWQAPGCRYWCMLVLGIESSCDETAAAVVEGGRRIISSIVASQVEVHHPYGGVVPELASRKHIEVISQVVRQALAEAGAGDRDIRAVAATCGPGLIGSLLVGFCFAKAFAFARGLPFLAVDHLEGHLESVQLMDDPPDYPLVALLASGGHTEIYHLPSRGVYRLLGRTRDDAVGEAYDKVAKMLGLGYPGGPVIDRLACEAGGDAVAFPRPFLNKEEFDFSFSGIKTAVGRYLAKCGRPVEQVRSQVAAGFQQAVLEVLVHKIVNAARLHGCTRLAVVGGVAANRGLRQSLAERCRSLNLKAWFPPLELCGDNAAMVAAVAHHRIALGGATALSADVYSRRPRRI